MSQSQGSFLAPLGGSRFAAFFSVTRFCSCALDTDPPLRLASKADGGTRVLFLGIASGGGFLAAGATAIPRTQIRATIERYLELEKQQRELDRESRAIGKLKGEQAARLKEHITASEPKLKVVMTCGYRLALIEKPGTVRWKDQFVQLAGESEAVRLQRETPPREALAVEVAGRQV